MITRSYSCGELDVTVQLMTGGMSVTAATAGVFAGQGVLEYAVVAAGESEVFLW